MHKKPQTKNVVKLRFRMNNYDNNFHWRLNIYFHTLFFISNCSYISKLIRFLHKCQKVHFACMVHPQTIILRFIMVKTYYDLDYLIF